MRGLRPVVGPVGDRMRCVPSLSQMRRAGAWVDALIEPASSSTIVPASALDCCIACTLPYPPPHANVRFPPLGALSRFTIEVNPLSGCSCPSELHVPPHPQPVTQSTRKKVVLLHHRRIPQSPAWSTFTAAGPGASAWRASPACAAAMGQGAVVKAGAALRQGNGSVRARWDARTKCPFPSPQRPVLPSICQQCANGPSVSVPCGVVVFCPANILSVFASLCYGFDEA